MYYSTTKNLRNRIIRKEDILTIAQTLETICEKYDGKCDFTLYFYDKTFISDDSLALFQTSLFRQKDVQSISFSYKSELSEHKVEIHLWEQFYAQSELARWSVTSTDEAWFNAMQAKIGELMNGLPKHLWLRNMVEFPYILLTFLIFIAAEIGILKLLDFEWGVKTEDVAIFIPLPLLMIATMLFMVLLMYGTYWLCPNIEFLFDTPKFIARKRIRKVLAWICGTIIVPVVLSLIV